MKCPNQNECGEQPRSFLDIKDKNNFVEQDRENASKALRDYLEHHRRGFIVLCGDRGQGKSRLVSRVLGTRTDPVYRWTVHAEERERRIVGVWADLSVLGITPLLQEKEKEAPPDPGSPGSNAASAPKAAAMGLPLRGRLRVESADFDSLSILMALTQALVDHLGPHGNFRRYGKGLRTILAAWAYHAQIPNHRIPKEFHRTWNWLQKLGSKPRPSQAVDQSSTAPAPHWLFWLYTALWAAGYPLLGIYGLYLLSSRFPLLPSAYYALLEEWPLALAWVEVNHDYFWPSVLGPGVIAWLFYLLLVGRLKWHYPKRQEARLRNMAYAAKYKRSENATTSTSVDLDPKQLAGFHWLVARKFLKRQEEAEYSSDVPNLLHELQIFLFQLHRRGISPVLVIDELDKLGASSRFLEAITQPCRCWDFEKWLDLRRSWQGNTQLLRFVDIMVRFKESLGSCLSLILIGDLEMARLLEHSETHDGPYHTLVREKILLGPIGWQSWMAAFKKGMGSMSPNCAEPLQDGQRDGQGKCECSKCSWCHSQLRNRCRSSCGSGALSSCCGHRTWSRLIWIEGEGKYARMFSRQRGYALQNWPYGEMEGDLIWGDHVTDLVEQFKQANGSKYAGWFPGDPCSDTLDVDVQSGLMAILHTLLRRLPVYLPVGSYVPVNRQTEMRKSLDFFANVLNYLAQYPQVPFIQRGEVDEGMPKDPELGIPESREFWVCYTRVAVANGSEVEAE